MRPWRSIWTRITVYAAFVLLFFSWLPFWLALLVVVAAVKLDKWHYYRRSLEAAEQPVDDPGVALAGLAACERVGLAGTEVVAVRGNSGPYLNLRDGRLFIARGAKEMLTEAELDAALLHRSVTPRGHAWRVELEPHLPWGALTLLLSLLGEDVRVPLIGLAHTACLMAWAWSVGVRRAYCPWLAPEHFQAFLDRGGDGRALAGALAKAAWHVAGDLPQGSIQDRSAARAWANLELLASMCGMSEAELVTLAEGLGVSDLYASAGKTTWHRMGFARTIFLIPAVAFGVVLIIGMWMAGSLSPTLGQLMSP
ncbi:MAG: hypothetical protein K0R39_2561 [Symbiobacteriaceae bacterium]|nr:hypothetical protein [Symbiobacteriaceae bacterium]